MQFSFSFFFTNKTFEFFSTWSSQKPWNRSSLEARFWWWHLSQHQHAEDSDPESTVWNKAKPSQKSSLGIRFTWLWFIHCCLNSETWYLNLGPMAATCRFRLLLDPPTLRHRDLCKMVVKISTWSALLYFAISNLCTKNWRGKQEKGN